MNTLSMYLVALLKAYFPTLDGEEGQGMVEYALIIALVAIVLALALTSLQGGIGGVFDTIVSKLGGGGGS